MFICKSSRWPPGWETAVHLAVAGGVFDGVFFVLSFFPLDVFDRIWDFIESVSEVFLFFPIFSSPEHEVLMVSYCDQSLSVVRRLCVVNILL